MLNTLIFGITNGYYSTLCAILGPQFVPENLKQETGSFVGTVIVSGITLGTALAIPMGQLIAIAP
jgi:predicted MFS family arabinose efflux permease